MDSNLDTQLLKYESTLFPNTICLKEIFAHREHLRKNEITATYPFCRAMGIDIDFDEIVPISSIVCVTSYEIKTGRFIARRMRDNGVEISSLVGTLDLKTSYVGFVEYYDDVKAWEFDAPYTRQIFDGKLSKIDDALVCQGSYVPNGVPKEWASFFKMKQIK